tara:strand:+ start:336 stop:536 length:201 start_codon:yes stop_codon:yes gene_type:complete
MNLKQLKAFFETYEFKDEEIQLNKASKILNQKNFVESHIKVLEANTGKKLMMPYYARLLAFYEIVK